MEQNSFHSDSRIRQSIRGYAGPVNSLAELQLPKPVDRGYIVISDLKFVERMFHEDVEIRT